MTTATETKPAAEAAVNGPVKAIVPAPEERAVEYVPFGAKEKLRLTVNLVRKFIAKPTKSGALASEADAMKFIMLCKARYLNPWEGDAFLVGYDGKDGPEFSLITAHQVFLKRAEVNQEYDGMESGVIVKDGEGVVRDREGDFLLDDDTLLGSWATVHFKTRKFPMKKRLMLRARRKDNKFWNGDTSGMIVKCAETDALRASFPTTLGGLYLEDEMLPAVAEVTTPPPEGRIAFREKPDPSPPPAEPSGSSSAASAQTAAGASEDWPLGEVTLAEGEIPADQAAEAEALERIDGFKCRIEEAGTKVEGARIAADLQSQRDALGPVAYAGLKAALAERMKHLAKK